MVWLDSDRYQPQDFHAKQTICHIAYKQAISLVLDIKWRDGTQLAMYILLSCNMEFSDDF
jgi:hypothetical protein